MEVTDVKDMTGWPIVIGGRVRVKQTLTSGKHFYKHGEVIKIVQNEKHGTMVEVRLFKNLNVICATPSQVQVMKGKTRNSFEYELLKERMRKK
jgi:hypothetical protein